MPAGILGLTVPLLMLSDWPYFIAAHSEGIFGTSISNLDGRLPLYLMTAIALMVAMIVAHPPPAGANHGRFFGFVAAGILVFAFWILLGVAFIVGMAKWLHFMQKLGPEEAPHPLFVPMFMGAMWVTILNPYVCALFVGLIAWCVVASRRPERFSDASRDPT